MGNRVVTPKNCDTSVKKAIQQLASQLAVTASPSFASFTLTDLTASSLVGTNASKTLESVTVSTGLDYTRPTLSLSHLGIEALTDPGSDKILFWDDSETACKWLGIGNSIAITTTTIDTIQDIRTTASPTFAACSLGTGELTCGSINRATGTLTLEIAGTAEISITTTTVTLGGNLIIPNNGTIGSVGDTDVMTIDASGNCTFSVFPITPSAAPDANYEVANKKYVDDVHAGAPAAHTIVSHSDTTGTGAELNTLTGGGDVGALHTHAAAYQPLDAELTSLATLSYVAASFVKMTGANTFALRTIGETADDLQGTIDHDLTANYDANKHIDHTGVSITAGKGLSGGGDISSTRTLALDLAEMTGNVSWDDGTTDASITWTYALSGANDPVWTIGSNSMDLTTGVLKVGGTTVMLVGGAATAHALLDGSVHSDSVADDVSQGSLIYGNGTPKWDELVIGTGFLRGDGTDCAWLSYANSLAALSGVAGAAFSFNDQNITNVGSIAVDSVVSDGAAAALTITATAGQAVTVEDVSFDGGVVSGMGTLGCGAITGTSTAIFEGASVTVGKASTTTGTIVLHDSGSANTITLTVPNALAGSLSFTLPPTDGDNTNVLQTNGSGVLTWVAAGAGASTWIALTDTDPANYTGQAGNTVVVNAGEDGLEFGAAPGGAFTSKCSVYRNATQAITTATWTKVQLNTEYYDTDGEFDNATNYRFQPSVTGYYSIKVGAAIDTLLANKSLLVAISKNGVVWKLARSIAGVTVNHLLSLGGDAYLLDTDYIELWVYHDNGNNRNILSNEAYTFMDVHRFA